MKKFYSEPIMEVKSFLYTDCDILTSSYSEGDDGNTDVDLGNDDSFDIFK